LLAVAGIQTTLRFNADVSKQNSEAVRIAQAEVERWRAFPVLATTPGKVAYQDLLSSGVGAAVTGSNTVFTVTRTVNTLTAPAYKVLTVDVSWTDRNNAPQSVRLTSNLAGVAPELSATVAIRAYGSPTAQARGRNGAIPPAAVPLGESPNSAFRPPQATGGTVVWRFDNTTALIATCTSTETSTANLTLANVTGCSGRSQLLTGFVRFATDTAPATAADAFAPMSASFPVGVRVIQSFPTGNPDTVCYTEQASTFIRYFCAVPVSSNPGNSPIWSGRAVLDSSALLTAADTETSASLRRVCRYTRYRDDRAVGTASNQMRNDEHPLNYSGVGVALTNQNFLLIQAGNGAVPYLCPENTAQPVYNTWQHPLN